MIIDVPTNCTEFTTRMMIRAVVAFWNHTTFSSPSAERMVFRAPVSYWKMK